MCKIRGHYTCPSGCPNVEPEKAITHCDICSAGMYKKLNVISIKEGELISYNPLEEEIEVKLIEDDVVRENTETIGYYAMFEYSNGFKKSIYWSKAKMESHALKYSQGFRADKNKGTNYTFWSKDFDGMAYKTLLRQLISKWGIMSIEMQEVFSKDMAVIHEDGNVDYIDNSDFIQADTGEHEIIEQDEPTEAKEVDIDEL